MRIFLSLPMTSYYEDLVSQRTQDYFKWVRNVTRHLRSKGHEVFCAFEHEDWGCQPVPPAKDVVQRDLSALCVADLLIVLADNWQSHGVALEVGSALADNKPTLFICQNEKSISWPHDYDPDLRYFVGYMQSACGRKFVRHRNDYAGNPETELLSAIDDFISSNQVKVPLRRLTHKYRNRKNPWVHLGRDGRGWYSQSEPGMAG